MGRSRWSQFASEIYKVGTIVYGTYNVGTWSFHQSCTDIIITLLGDRKSGWCKLEKQEKRDTVLLMLAKQIYTPRNVILIDISREGNGLRPTSLFKWRVSAIKMNSKYIFLVCSSCLVVVSLPSSIWSRGNQWFINEVYPQFADCGLHDTLQNGNPFEGVCSVIT